MPAPVSRKQYRYIMAILHSKKKGTSSRGDRMPLAIAAKYADKDADVKNLPESKGKEHKGGSWNKKSEKSSKNKLKKAFEEYYAGKGCGCVVLNDRGHILVGEQKDGLITLPGGHVEANESFEEAAKRELQEESGLTAVLMREIGEGTWEGNHSKVFVVDSFKGKLGYKTDGELKSLAFISPENILWDKLRFCARQCLELYFNRKVNKSLVDMLAVESLAKNIARREVGSDVTYEMSHADALRLVGNSTFKMLKNIVDGMRDEDFKDVKLDNYTISIRKHSNDVYSGRVVDGHKLVHQWTNRSLPAMTAELMSVFEWYSPEDEHIIESINESDIPEDAIDGGLNALVDHYKKHNIANIYTEMENIKTDIRNGAAVDLQQVEQRIMKLFDKLEEKMLLVVDKHNELANQSGTEIDQLCDKLRELQSKVEQLSYSPAKVEAYSTNPSNPSEVHQENYMYLKKPHVEIHPDGRIVISFSEDWMPIERENFLRDMRARVLQKPKR